MILLLSLLAFNDDNVLTSDSLRAQWMIPGSSSVESNLHYDDLATEPTGIQWRQRSYFRQSQSPMDETRIVQRRDQPTLWCSYFSRRMGPVDATRFKRRDQPHREWLISRVNYDVLASDIGWHSLTRVEKNLLLSKFKVKTICIHVTEVIIVPRWRGKALQGHKQPISSNQTINY